MPPKSILRNAPETGYSPSNDKEIDRHQVLENTRANARLHDVGATIKQDSGEPGAEDDDQQENGAGLKWDEANIYLNEQDKTAKMKIDEPKTPFQGAVGSSEYYLPDEEEEGVKTRGDKKIAVDELDEFSLGEPQYKNLQDSTVQNDRIERADVEDDETGNDEDDDDEQLSAEERHRRFEEKRKAHYHMKGDVLKHPVPPPEDED